MGEVRNHAYFYDNPNWRLIDDEGEPVYWNPLTKEVCVVGADYCLAWKTPKGSDMRL